MCSERFLDKKQLKKLDKEFQKVINRRGLDRKTEDEVFDKNTLKTLEKLISDRIIDIVDFPISTGKEGNVFRAVTPDKKIVAVKIYRISTSTFKHISNYILGDPRFDNIHKNHRNLVFAWTTKEYRNLQLLEQIDVFAPRPIKCLNNVLVMQYIGTKDNSAPLLKDVELKNPDKVFEKIIYSIDLMYKKANLVHADLSSYNVLIHKNKPYIIDLGQAVLLEHLNAKDFLRRDVHNIVNYFKKYNIKADEKEIYKNIVTLKKD